MPFILRKIRKGRWYIGGISWVEEGDIHADPLADLNTKDNELSVWLVQDDRSNLGQIVTAIAATRDHVSNLDYALLDLQSLLILNPKIKHTRGGTPDEEANASWHRDLHELSGLKLVELAKIILERAERRRFSKKDIGQLIAQAISSGRIDRARLKEGIRNKIKMD
jgi:hypothetical protein